MATLLLMSRVVPQVVRTVVTPQLSNSFSLATHSLGVPTTSLSTNSSTDVGVNGPPLATTSATSSSAASRVGAT